VNGFSLAMHIILKYQHWLIMGIIFADVKWYETVNVTEIEEFLNIIGQVN